MSTTTIRLSEDLKARIALAAKRSGVSPHNFILQAVEEKAEKDEAIHSFKEEADQRFTRLLKEGKTIAWSDMRSYLEGKIKGIDLPKPKASKRK
jgi:uncharacterized protein (DUF1778 family)